MTENTNYVGRTLGPYKIEAPLGKGGMAAVYRAYQASVKRYVAIKVMSSEIAGAAGFVERFEREAQVIAQLEHPHILPVIDYGSDGGVPYIVMRYIEGGSLDDRMRQRALSLQETARFINQIASALDYAHRRGVVHRDLKPNNVLLDKEENCYLTDFGIARLTGSDNRLTATGTVMGTPAYMSPEQAMGRTVDSRSDIYTLGVMLYEMVLSKMPFMADTPAALIFQHVYEQPTPPKQIKPDLPDAVVRVLDRALAKSPDARFQLASELAKAFDDAIRGVSPSTQAPAGGEERTFVGGVDAAPIPGTIPISSSASSTRPQEYQPTMAQPAAGYAPTMPPVSPTGATTPQRRSPLGLLAVLAVVVLIAVGAGAFFVVTNQQNELATQTAQAQASGTAQAVAIALSATATHTATSTATETPNFTQTAEQAELATVRAERTNAAATTAAEIIVQTASAATANANATSSAIANLTATADAQLTAVSAEQTAAANATVTAEYNATLNAESTRVAEVANATATASAAEPTPNVNTGGRVDGLVSDDPDEILGTVLDLGIVPSDSRAIPISIQSSDFTLQGADSDANVFIPERISAARFSNFLFSTDVEMTTSIAGLDKTMCGLFFHGRFDGNSFTDGVTISYRRDRYFEVYNREDNEWAASAVYSTNSDIIRRGSGDTNRLTVIMYEGMLSVYINGEQMTSVEERTFREGLIGYLMTKGVEGNTERCEYRNTLLWRLN
jgi:serine/threonine protein kinase